MTDPFVEEKVSIRPGVGLYAMFPSLKYSPWVALGEMVDNSIQSYLEHKEELIELNGPSYKLRIDINFTGGENPTILIADNAAGIFEKDIDRAFTPAMPPQNKTGISQYGIGMKSSACWYSNYFTIKTQALGDDVSRTVIFDIKKIIAEQTLELDIQKEQVRNAKAHGTRIIMRDLHQPIPMAGAASRVRSYLRSMYRDFLKYQEIEISINGDQLDAAPTEWLKSPYWDKTGPTGETIEWVKKFEIELNESFVPDPGNTEPPKIRGEIGILSRGDTKRAGLALIWRRKVVQGVGNLAESPDDLYRPLQIYSSANSFERQRIIGEIDVSELRVTSFKDAINWRPGQEEEALKKIKAILNEGEAPLLKMARNYRVLESSIKERKDVRGTVDGITATTSSLIDFENGSDPLILGDYAGTEIPEPSRSDVPSIKSYIKLRPNYSSDIELELKEQGQDPQWLRVSNDENGKWTITVNRDHPFMNSFVAANPDSLEPVLRIALAIGIAEIQGKIAGYETAGFLRLSINELLKKYLSSKNDITIDMEEENDS
jgi:hypothetical protein